MENENIFANVPTEGQGINEVLTSVDKELQEAKEETKVETKEPAESQTEKVIEKLDLPDESILKKNRAWEEMREKNEALESRLNALERPNTVEKSEFVSSLVGDNEEIEKKWQHERESLKEEVKKELIQSQLDAERQEREQKEHWIKWTEEKLSEVEKEFNVDFKADESKKNELSKIMLDYTPTDEAGNLDYKKGMKILNELTKAKVQEETQKTQVKKNLADATVSKETSVQKNKDYLTSNDFRGRSWRSVIGKD